MRSHWFRFACCPGGVANRPESRLDRGFDAREEVWAPGSRLMHASVCERPAELPVSYLPGQATGLGVAVIQYPGGGPSPRWVRFSNRVYRPSKCVSTVPVAPCRFFPMITSAMFGFSVSLL